MHELSVASELYQGLKTEIDRRGGGRLSAVKILVGELAALEPDLLRFAWEAVVEESADVGASLEIEWRHVAQRCPACGDIEEAVPGSWLRPCPTCGIPLRLEGGRELEVVSFTYDDETRSGDSRLRESEPLECKA